MSFRRPALLAAAALALALAACDMPWSVSGGSGTETSNGEVVARVLLADGEPAVGAPVFVRPADYLRDTMSLDTLAPSPDAHTDREGRVWMRGLKAGSYRAEVKDGRGLAALIPFDVPEVLPPEPLPAIDTLRPVGTLQGRAEPVPGSTGPLYVQVYGMERLVRTDTAGFFVLPDMPPGPVKFRVLSSDPGAAYPSPSLAVVPSGGTVEADTLRPITFANEDYALWPFSRRVYINTLGAGIADTVHDFPLLVRLDGNRYDFDLSDGKDVRFSGRDGRHLPYQIDYWDPAARQAAVWVRLDTVLGGSRDQYITLHFGKRDAPDFSDGPRVFSSFGGVWHFSEAVDDNGEGFFPDASPSGSAGAARILPKERLGAIGPGAGFRGTHSVVAGSRPVMSPARNFTLSAWVYLTGAGEKGAEFVSYGDNYGLRGNGEGNVHLFVNGDTTVTDGKWRPEGGVWPGVWTTGKDVRGAWRLVTGRYDGVSLKLYLDGVEAGSRAYDKAVAYVFGRDMRMGQHGNDAPVYGFTGSLDEVQMSPLARSPGWIRLAYENQRAGSLLLEFR